MVGTASGPVFWVTGLVHRDVRASMLALVFLWKTEPPEGSSKLPQFQCNTLAIQFWHGHSDVPEGVVQAEASRQKHQRLQIKMQQWTRARRDGTQPLHGPEEFKRPWRPQEEKPHGDGFGVKKQAKSQATCESQRELQIAIEAKWIAKNGPGKGSSSPQRKVSPRRQARKEASTPPAPSLPLRQCKPQDSQTSPQIKGECWTQMQLGDLANHRETKGWTPDSLSMG